MPNNIDAIAMDAIDAANAHAVAPFPFLPCCAIRPAALAIWEDLETRVVCSVCAATSPASVFVTPLWAPDPMVARMASAVLATMVRA